MATKLGQKNPWYKFMMMMTFMEVKGHQRSNVINYVLWLPNFVRRIPDASSKWWPSLRSSEVKGSKLCAMATKLGQKNPWYKIMMMMTFMEVKGHQRSTVVNCTMVTKLGQKNPWCKFKMMMTFMEVKGHQRSNGVNYVLWLPYLVKRITDASLKCWWHSWKSKVTWGQV